MLVDIVGVKVLFLTECIIFLKRLEQFITGCALYEQVFNIITSCVLFVCCCCFLGGGLSPVMLSRREAGGFF